LLRDAGLPDPVFWIRDVKHAIAYLRGDPPYVDRNRFPFPEVILLDLGMPEVDGYHFLKWLRTQPEVAKIFVVVLTAEMDLKRIQLAYQLGANSYLAKSAGVDEFRNFVAFLKSMSRIVNLAPCAGAPTTLPAITPVELTSLDLTDIPEPMARQRTAEGGRRTEP